MANDKIYHVGVMLGNIHTQHPKELIEGIYEAACNENVNVTLFLGAQGNAFDFWKQSNASGSMTYQYQFNYLYDYALISKLDVLIISYGTLCIYFDQDDKEEFFSKFRQVPLIILEEYEEDSEDSFIMSDNYGSMTNIMEHLITHHKYEKILHISGPLNNTDATERRTAYIDSMKRHGLKVTESMIGYGDYSTDVDDVVSDLLNKNPGAQAIVSANDEMAISAYRVCKRKGLVIGKDIAITGYDDIELAQRMDPPLTTAEQDGLDMGYKALKLAVSVCREHTAKQIKLPAHFKQRGSCGCAYYSGHGQNLMIEVLKMLSGHEDISNIEAAATCAVQSSLRSINTAEATSICREYFIKFIELLLKIRSGLLTDDNKQDIGAEALKLVRELFITVTEEYLNISRFTETMHEIIEQVMASTVKKDAMLLEFHVLEVTDTYIESYVMHESAETYNILQRKNWMAPAMIQKMVENVGNEKQFYRLAMEHIKAQGARSAYLYIMKTPKRYPRGKEFKCPKEMYLASEYVGGIIKSYAPDERPVVSMKDGISSRYPDTPGHRYVAFILFAEEYQFGLMLCETDAGSVGILYGIGLQISTAQAYLQMSKKELAAKQRLYDAMKTLEDKNQILNFISSSDPLTGMYNRRGFMERAIEAFRKNKGKKAVVFFSDLDHLKQINDLFGHADGDYALTHAAEILKTIFAHTGFSGRIGGDEFVSFALDKGDDYVADALKEIKEACAKLNDSSGKPFYIEFSTGYIEFTCSDDISIPKIVDQADKVLYEAKKTRRQSIAREV
ncbi:MAG: GGDEF domain-containing protein [Lachnospiraceae bacterium]|nr:GGDEF domain-containing protein [Lachnospiraceae bacterium]